MIKKTVEIINKLGLHARAAAKMVNEVNRYSSEVNISCNKKSANAKSIMDVMMLAARKGTLLEISVEGDDEDAAMQAVEKLISNKFGEAE